MIPPFIYVSRCGLRRTAYCSGREETRCAEICQQRVELLDDVLYACRIGNSCRRARIARSSRPSRAGGTGWPLGALRAVAADKPLWSGRTSRTSRAGRSGRAHRSLRPGGASRTGCSCGTLRTLRSCRTDSTCGPLRALNALRSGRPCRPDCTCYPCGALDTLNALRSGRTHRAGYALNALHALRTRRPDHTGAGIRRKRRRGRHGTGRRKIAATIVLKTVDDDHPPLIPCRISPALHPMLRDREGERCVCALSVNDVKNSCKDVGGMLTCYNM